MKQIWQLQEAKNQLSVVVDQALEKGPQTITRHGQPVVVVIAASTYKKLVKPKQPLSVFCAGLPLRGVALDLSRDKTPVRGEEL